MVPRPKLRAIKTGIYSKQPRGGAQKMKVGFDLERYDFLGLFKAFSSLWLNKMLAAVDIKKSGDSSL